MNRHKRFRKKDSQSQELDRIYRLLSDRYGVDLDTLVYGKNGFMKTRYPNGFPDFQGDVVYSEKYWNEFERWLAKEQGVTLSDEYSEYADSKRRRISKIDNAMKPQSNKIRKRDSETITHKRRKRDGYDYFYGTKGVEYYPSNYGGKIYYKGYEFDYFDVEDALWEDCVDEYGESRANNDEFFTKYVQENVKPLLELFIDMELYSDKGYPIRDSRHRTINHDSKPRYKTFIVKATSYNDALQKVKKKLKN